MDSLRLRLTVVSTVVVAVVLATAAAGLWGGQRRVLEETLDASLQQRADELEARYLDGPASDFSVGIASSDEDRAVQLVSARGGVVAASANMAGLAPLAVEPLPNGTDGFSELDDVGFDDDTYRVLSREVTGSDEIVVLHVLQSTDDMAEAAAALAGALMVSIPLVVVALGALMWWLVGRTLEPVELAAEAHRRFVADAAHELRTPLTRIRTAAEIGVGSDDPDGELAQRTIAADAIELQHLIEDLLHLARTDAGEPIRTGPVDLDDIVLAECAQLRAPPSRVEIDSKEVSGAHLVGDAAQLTRMVRNLLTNAVHHAQAAVQVSLREIDSTVELAIADDGPGVPEADRERIFDRFARVDESRARSDGGAGLGLAIARDIVSQHGGSVVYDGDRSSGACFVVRLPGGA